MSDYSAYIDESGCDGFDFDNGSTDFLVLGAVIARTSGLVQFDAAIAKARVAARKPEFWTFGTFKDLKSAAAQRWALAKALSAVKCQVVAVAVHKKSLTEGGWQQSKDDLYFQASKFLLERISWSIRDVNSVKSEGDPRCRIVFSRRGSLRYDQLARYMERLRADPSRYSTNADWNHLDPGLVTDEPHDNANALHLAADHFSAAIGSALNVQQPGLLDMFDDRYARLWAERFYKSNGRVVGNGLKIWPNEGYSPLRNDQRGQWMKMSFQW